MSTIKSQSELYDEFIQELQAQAPELTDTNEGSQIDTIAGVVSLAISELSRLTLDEVRKTFFDTAHGPEETGEADDLEVLAVDHFGEDFARPAATSATGIVAFSRANTGAGDCIIPAGTIVKTVPNANGESQRFATDAEVTLTSTSINASVTAVVAGIAGNVLANKVTLIEDALTDSSVAVNNSAVMAGGDDEESDSEYRETIRNLIASLAGATLAAIEAAAQAVAGIETATAIENPIVVIEYDIATSLPVVGADFFSLPDPIVYVADANGTADDALLAAVKARLATVRAAGVPVKVRAAIALELDWTASVTLNPSGPNYATLNSDSTMLVEAMQNYIADLDIGSDFVRSTADAAMLAMWGPAGTDDLTAFDTSIPIGDIESAANEKLIAGTVEID